MYEVPNTDSDFNPATGILENTDNDAWPNYFDNDDDGDTVLTIYEINNSDNDQNPNTGIPLDTDGDGIPNYLDVDDDNDGYATREPVETDNITDTDGNTYTNPHDSDNDGIVSHLDPNEAVFPPNEEVVLNTFTNFTGDKQYELSNHLGNVLVVVSDKKIPNVANGILKHYLPEVVSYSDYDPFGSLLPGRHGSAIGYRYGFQGQEKDDEVKGEGNSLNYTFRMHDTRLGRFFARDPLESTYSFYSPYAFSGNRVIDSGELEGLEPAEKMVLETAEPVLKVVWKSTNVVTPTTASTLAKTLGKGIGMAAMLLTDSMSPNFGGRTSEMPLPNFIPLNEIKPSSKPISVPSSIIDAKFKDDKKDNKKITLYRGVSSVNLEQYNQAKMGIAVPKGLIPSFKGTAHSDMDDHAMGDNYSIWTSWTTDKNMANNFAKGPTGKSEGVILTKTFTIGKDIVPNTSFTALLMGESEWLAPGVVTGAKTKEVIPDK